MGNTRSVESHFEDPHHVLCCHEILDIFLGKGFSYRVLISNCAPPALHFALYHTSWMIADLEGNASLVIEA